MASHSLHASQSNAPHERHVRVSGGWARTNAPLLARRIAPQRVLPPEPRGDRPLLKGILDGVRLAEEVLQDDPHACARASSAALAPARHACAPRMISVKKNRCTALSIARGPSLYGFTYRSSPAPSRGRGGAPPPGCACACCARRGRAVAMERKAMAEGPAAAVRAGTRARRSVRNSEAIETERTVFARLVMVTKLDPGSAQTRCPHPLHQRPKSRRDFRTKVPVCPGAAADIC